MQARSIEIVRRHDVPQTVVIRAYANLHRPHPEMVGDHITVTLVHKIRTFLNNAEQGIYRVVRSILSWEACAKAEDMMRHAVVAAHGYFDKMYK